MKISFMACKEGQFDAVELMLKIKLLKIGLEEIEEL